MGTWRLVVVSSLAAGCLAGAASADTVLTGNQATFSITSALAEGTTIEVANVPEDGREMSVLTDYVSRRMDRLAPTFAAATAVVTVMNALPGDPLYRYARDANIRIVAIDAAIPWSPSMPGVALAAAPASDVPWANDTDAAGPPTAPYFWLSVANAVRMADIIAHDLGELFPEESAAIAANLESLKRSLLGLRRDYQDRLLELDDVTVFALTSDFVYLTNDLGLFVDGYFIKQDIRWTDADLAALTRHLRERSIRVVIHKWEPSEAIQAAVAAGGAELVVLASGDPGIVAGDSLARDGLQQILTRNLDALLTALGP